MRAAGLSLAGTGTATAQQGMAGMHHPKGTQRTISGTVVDVSCRFGQGLSGDSHRECAQICAGKGIPLAILGTDGKLYVRGRRRQRDPDRDDPAQVLTGWRPPPLVERVPPPGWRLAPLTIHLGTVRTPATPP